MLQKEGMKDSVLRCLVDCTIDGERCLRLVDAFADKGGNYALVLEWIYDPTKEGELPGKALGVAGNWFEPVSEPGAKYELRCRGHIDFDKVAWDNISGHWEKMWNDPDNLFHPRPNDEESGDIAR